MIEEIKHRLEKITPGEWRYFGVDPNGDYCISAPMPDPKTGFPFCPRIISVRAWGGPRGIDIHQWDEANAEFIAHAPADLRWAVAEIERLEQELDLRQALDVTPSLIQQLNVANATAQTVPPLLERIGQLEADNAQLRAALAWAHDAIWTAHSKRETETLDNWLNRRAGRKDMFVGFTEALDYALADYDRNKDPVVQLTEEVDQLRAALERYERCTHYDSRLQETCNHCHACMHITGHAEDCWWAAAMKGKG